MNFIRGMLAIQDCAARQELSSNDMALLLAIFRVYNDRHWPSEPQRIGNNELLSHCTFHGSARDKVLRQTRERLQERGLITYEKGTPYGPLPLYSIRWEALGLADETPAAQPMEQPTAQHAPQDTAQHSAQTGGMFDPENDKIINININDQQTEPAAAVTNVCVSGGRTHTMPAAWFNPGKPDGPDDGAWKYSERARCAIAQRMIDYAEAQGIICTDWPTEDKYGRLVYVHGPDLFNVMVKCMEAGMSPGAIMRCDHGETSDWSVSLKREARAYMGTMDFPMEWGDSLDIIDREKRESDAIMARLQERLERRCQ